MSYSCALVLGRVEHRFSSLVYVCGHKNRRGNGGQRETVKN